LKKQKKDFVNETYISWFFSEGVDQITYAVAVFRSSFQAKKAREIDSIGVAMGTEFSQVRIEVIDLEAGEIAISDLPSFLANTCSEHETSGDKIILDDTPQMRELASRLKKAGMAYSQIKRVLRVGTTAEQVARYRPMINSDRYFLLESILVKSDLISVKPCPENLVDPIESDEQTIYPMTQALLIGFHFLDTRYVDSSMSVGRRGANNFWGGGGERVVRGFPEI